MKLNLGLSKTKKAGVSNLGKPRKAMSRLFTYIIALILSISFWFVQSLQSTTTTTIRIPLNYDDIYTKFYTQENLPKYIEVEVKDKVSHLMSFDKDATSMKVAPQKIGSLYYIKMSRKDIVDYISSILPTTSSILKVSPSSINYTLSAKSEKNVPLYIDKGLPIQSGYMAYPPIFSPSEVTLYGDEHHLNTIKNIVVKLPKIKSISDTISFRAAINIPSGTTSALDSVDVMIPVELISQLKLTLPINVVGQPQDTTMHTLPSTAQVNIAMPISKLRELKNNKDLRVDNQIAIGVVYPRERDDFSPSDMSSLKVELIEKPQWVTSYTITPAKVQYILETKKR